MTILTIRTDKPDAEIGLFHNNNQLSYDVWLAHRELAETIHSRIKQNLQSSQLDYVDVKGVIVYKGPGSFTGLRIGISVANALASGLQVPIASAMGDEWIETGIKKLLGGENYQQVVPEYGAEPHITKQKK